MNTAPFLRSLYDEAVAAASAAASLPALLPQGAAAGRTIVLGCGKAAAAMAEVASAELQGEVTGCVVTRYGHGARGDTGGIAVIEASHPVPDEASLMAGRTIRELAASAGEGDRVVFLISGGGSALLCDPIPGLSLAEKAQITDHLVKSGVAIGQINLVRRHLSQVKGGRLAAAAAGASQLYTYLISDVAGDDPKAIASGPSIAAAPSVDDALAVLAGSGWEIDEALVSAMRAAIAIGTAPAHPVHMIATAQTALEAAAASASAAGWNVVRLGDELEGDAAETGRAHAAVAMDYAARSGCHLLLSGGELTVKVRAAGGRGGPNLEYLTGLMAAVPERAPVTALACDTDGIDGSEDNAGGWFDATHRASSERCAAALAANRSYDLFGEIGTLIITGPTRTNVNDIRMIAVEGAQ